MPDLSVGRRPRFARRAYLWGFPNGLFELAEVWEIQPPYPHNAYWKFSHYVGRRLAVRVPSAFGQQERFTLLYHLYGFSHHSDWNYPAHNNPVMFRLDAPSLLASAFRCLPCQKPRYLRADISKLSHHHWGIAPLSVLQKNNGYYPKCSFIIPSLQDSWTQL